MSKATVLIVEDEAIVAEDLAGKLRRLSYEVAGITSEGEEAVALARDLHPALVLMDISLDGPLDGIEAAEAIRRQHDVPVIYLTAHSDPVTLSRAKITDPFGYILKPFDQRDLATQIELALHKHQADRQLRQQREWLRVTLTSIGDAVIATDAAARIAFLNPVAESVTGWNAEEAAGQVIPCVFRIVNEQTGQPLDDPVARVLREGRAVELANHAALVTKDGRTVPIEDSAAPILDAAGQVIGVVLVFHDVTEKRRAEDALRQSEQRMRLIAQAGRIGFVEWNAAKDTAYWSPEHYGLFGFEPGSPVSWERWLRGVYPEDRGRVVENAARLLERGRLQGQVQGHKDEYRYIRPDGTVVWLEADMSVEMVAGEPIVRGSVRDITQRKRAEQNEERFATLLNHNPSLLFLKDEDGRYVYLNPAYEKQYALTQDWLGKTDYDFWPKESAELFRENDVKALESGEICQFLEDALDVDGNRHCWLCYKFPFTDSQGQRYVGGIGIDSTARVLAEEALRESEQRYRALFDSMAEGFALHEIVTDEQDRPVDYRFLEANAAFERLTGLKRIDLLGKRASEVLPGLESHWIESFGRVALTGEPAHLENYSADLDRWYEAFVYRPGPRQFAVVFTDITDRKRDEQALRESEMRYRLLHESLRDGFVQVDMDGRIIEFNNTYCQMLGYSPEELRALTYQDLTPERWHVVEADIIRNQIMARGYSDVYEKEYRRKDGTIIPIELRTILSRDEAGRPISMWGIVRDITDRKRAEEALRQSRENLDRAQEVAQIGWWRLDTRRNVLSWSDENYRIFGVPKETPLSYETFLAIVHPDDRQYVDTQWNASLRGEPYDIEHRIVADGQVKWVREKAYLEFDDAGGLLGGFGITQDITTRKNVEEALQQAKAAAEAASAAKSQFLANMSHELRTPMNAILGMIDVALPKATDPIVQDCLQTAKGSADLLLMLLNDLLDSAKIESGKLELESAPFSLRRMLDQITRVLAVRASEKGLCFFCRLPENTPDAVVGDRMRLQQVLLNLASNAIKFTERGDVEISLRAVSHNGEACLEFAVRDTGIGIPPAGLARLFQPFAQADASMSRRFGGTGLGLSICQKLVEIMGGRIWVESELGTGSTFYFTVRLPLAKEHPIDFETPVALPTTACGPLRVLLVEDNPANQKLATYILRDRGHVVEIAGDGQETLRLTEQNRYDVILMDVQMPGMNGLEATAAIRRRENGGRRVPIIAMTAHAMKGDRERCLAAGMDGYLSKPVNAREMIGLVEALACGAVPTAQIAAAVLDPAEALACERLPVFNPEEALIRCFNSADMVREMSQYFLHEVDNVFPQMRTALEKGDLMEVGRLGHRIKGTVAYLGAQPAKQAALRVERFCKSSGGTPSEAEEAVNALEHECIALQAALIGHPLPAESETGRYGRADEV